MSERAFRSAVLAFLRVPERPEPPPGDDPSLRTFRASRRDLWYQYAIWAPGQITSLLGLIFSFAILRAMKGELDFNELIASLPRIFNRFSDNAVVYIPQLDDRITSFFFVLELFAAVTFLLQLALGIYLRKISWELRWYMVGDEFLRIREGLWKIREQTVKVANIQNMSIRQGPVQRLFGISELEIRTAGGGSGTPAAEQAEGSTGLHVARFRGIENAQELRDRLRSSLRHRRDAGLGDAQPDAVEPPVPQAQTATPPTAGIPTRSAAIEATLTSDAAEAARDLAEQARALRRAFARSA